jgi:PIN domain nuclease of toxin-antitoxin system
METLIYLDTHVVVWLYAGRTDLLSERVMEAVQKRNLVYSPIVRLELQYLLETDRISKKPDQILDALSVDIGLHPDHSDFSIIIGRALGLNWTRDPFDRIITAQASVNQAPLITKDQTIIGHYKKAFWD